MITLQQAASLYKVHLSTIYRWITKFNLTVIDGKVKTEDIQRAYDMRKLRRN